MADRDRYYFLLARAANVVRRGADAQTLAAAGVTTVQAAALMIIAAGEAPSQRDLGRSLSLGEPAVTGLVTRLARLDLVERVADPQDGRITRLRVTDAGKVAIEAVEPARRRTNAELDRLFGDDGPAVAAALRRLVEFDPRE